MEEKAQETLKEVMKLPSYLAAKHYTFLKNGI